MSQLESSVRDLISRYVAASITVDELSHRLPDGWDLDEGAEPDVKQLVLRTIGHIADYQRDVLSEDELRRILGRDASWHVARVFEGVSLPQQTSPVETRVRAGARTPHREVHAS